MAKMLGRRPPHPRDTHPRLQLSSRIDYRTSAVPPVIDWTRRVKRWPMYLNDELGDCTVAAAGHQIESWTAEAGAQHTLTTGAVLRAYSAVSGYDGTPSTDQGAVLQDVLGYWRHHGLAGHKIAAFAELDPHDRPRLMAALYWFGGLYVGVNMPASAMEQTDRTQPWTVNGDGTILGGHAVHVAAAMPSGFTCTTWGRLQTGSWDWWAAYVEEAWVAVSKDWLAANRAAPNGLDIAGLNVDFHTLTGQPGPF